MLNEILRYCCRAVSADTAQSQVLKQSAESALPGALWDITREPEEPCALEFRGEGSAATILHWN
jgi:hypothetical protein